MRKIRNAKLNLLMYVVAVLFCATLFSMHFVGGLYARYTAKISGSDSARIAAFRITGEGTIFSTLEANVSPNTTQSVTLQITNNSEVAVEYTVKVTNMTGNIPPLRFQLTSEDGTAAGTTEYANGVSTNKVRRTPGTHTDKYHLSIVWEPSENPDDDLALIGMVDVITISVTATQVD